jgi:hypothetical protein
MKQVRIDDEVFAAIQARAEPLVDDVNSVLRRVLLEGGNGTASPGNLPRSTPPRGGRAAPGSILSEREYESPILVALMRRGGKGHATEITDAVGEALGDRLTDLDRGNLDSGEVRWRNRVQFTRLTLRKRGLLKSNSPRGIWELTEAGWEAARRAEG